MRLSTLASVVTVLGTLALTLCFVVLGGPRSLYQ
jgi:hypothetical protein